MVKKINININYYMENYCLNIDTNTLKEKICNKCNNYEYNFLNNIKLNDIKLNDIEVYYDILNSYESFKLKNIYNFIYNRIIKLNNKYNIKKIDKINIKENIDPDKLNILLNNYIDDDIIRSIIIMNSIQQFYYPIR